MQDVERVIGRAFLSAPAYGLGAQIDGRRKRPEPAGINARDMPIPCCTDCNSNVIADQLRSYYGSGGLKPASRLAIWLGVFYRK